MNLSVVIVAFRRLGQLQDCLASLESQLAPQRELILIVNGADREILSWLQTSGKPKSQVRIFPTLEMPRSEARNFGAAQAQGNIIYFLDDDVLVPPGVLDRVVGSFEADATLAVLGGPNLTPPNSSFQESLYGAVMTSWFTAPMVCTRYGACSMPRRSATEHELILCNLAVRPAALGHSIAFQSMTSNEENLWLFRCKQEGAKMMYHADIGVFHH